MTPEQIVKQGEALIQASADAAYKAQLAFATGNYREYWESVGTDAAERLNAEWDKYSAPGQEQAEPSD